MRKYRITGLIFTILLLAAILAGIAMLGRPGTPLLYLETIKNGIAESGANNMVSAIYLDFRVFDTLLEALLLMTAVIGVSQFARLSGKEKVWEAANRGEAEKEQQPSRIMAASLSAVYPLLAVLGIYIIISGADSPGGGFQGGALLSGIFISVHFSTGKKLADIHLLETLEKSAYLLIGAAVSIFLVSHGGLSAGWHRGYFLLMNLLIGLKVFSGLTIIYFLFRSIPGRRL